MRIQTVLAVFALCLFPVQGAVYATPTTGQESTVMIYSPVNPGAPSTRNLLLPVASNKKCACEKECTGHTGNFRIVCISNCLSKCR